MAGKRQTTLNLFVSKNMPNDDETTPTSSESSQSNQLSEDLLTTLEEESLTNSLTTTNEVLDPTISSGSSLCSAQCCDDYSKAFQPKDEFTIKSLKSTGPAGKTRSFQTWYGQFPWISVCVTRKRDFVYIAGVLKIISC